uniref:Uncharacterized protein n=1 Tax=Heterorhabditis bacteriophora TaxID=37862 RepID=A0A1I7XIH7_HETBA
MKIKDALTENCTPSALEYTSSSILVAKMADIQIIPKWRRVQISNSLVIWFSAIRWLTRFSPVDKAIRLPTRAIKVDEKRVPYR